MNLTPEELQDIIGRIRREQAERLAEARAEALGQDLSPPTGERESIRPTPEPRPDDPPLTPLGEMLRDSANFEWGQLDEITYENKPFVPNREVNAVYEVGGLNRSENSFWRNVRSTVEISQDDLRQLRRAEEARKSAFVEALQEEMRRFQRDLDSRLNRTTVAAAPGQLLVPESVRDLYRSLVDGAAPRLSGFQVGRLQEQRPLENQALKPDAYEATLIQYASLGLTSPTPEGILSDTTQPDTILNDTPQPNDMPQYGNLPSSGMKAQVQVQMAPLMTVDPLKLKLELIYGRSGSGKTSWILALARYLFLKTGKRTRWYIADGGAETITLTGWAGPDGFIDLYLFSSRNNPMETCQLICDGYWPVNPLDPNTKMVPPTADTLETTGLWVFEGLTFMSDYMMGDKPGGLANRMARGERLNNDESFRLKDGDLNFGGNARTHYGFVQRRIQDLIQRTMQLPGLKYWTAHELKVDDTDNRESIFGPDVVGQKLTTKIGASFGNTIHMHVAHVEQKRKDAVTGKEVKVIEAEYRAYLQTHYDPDGQTTAKYYANTRVDARVRKAFPELVPEYINADPIAFYQIMDLARSKEQELDAQTLALPDVASIVSMTAGPTTRAIKLD